MAASLLPNGKQQFIDINGKPLVDGTVGMYVINTLTPKTTWQDSGQTILNTNPITLDSRGQALIYGSGTYRQIVEDALGNLIWDEPVFGIGGINAGGITAITHAQSPYTQLLTDINILCDTSGGDITINLIHAANFIQYQLNVKNNSTGNNVVYLKPQSGETVDLTGTNANPYQLGFPLEAISLISDLTLNWPII
jgi:hypothetical protein